MISVFVPLASNVFMSPDIITVYARFVRSALEVAKAFNLRPRHAILYVYEKSLFNVRSVYDVKVSDDMRLEFRKDTGIDYSPVKLLLSNPIIEVAFPDEKLGVKFSYARGYAVAYGTIHVEYDGFNPEGVDVEKLRRLFSSLKVTRGRVKVLTIPVENALMPMIDIREVQAGCWRNEYLLSKHIFNTLLLDEATNERARSIHRRISHLDIVYESALLLHKLLVDRTASKRLAEVVEKKCGVAFKAGDGIVMRGDMMRFYEWFIETIYKALVEAVNAPSAREFRRRAYKALKELIDLD